MEAMYAYNIIGNKERRALYDERAKYTPKKRNFWDFGVDSDPEPPSHISGRPARLNTSGMTSDMSLLKADRLIVLALILGILLRWYTWPKNAGTGVFNEEEDNAYAMEIDRKRKMKRVLTRDECSKLSLQQMEKMERTGKFEFPKHTQTLINEYRKAYHLD